MKKSKVITILFILIFVALFSNKVFAQVYAGTNMNSYWNNVTANSSYWDLNSNSFTGSCTGSTQTIRLYAFHSGAWEYIGNQTSTCSGDNFTTFGWTAFNPVFSTFGYDGLWAIVYGGNITDNQPYQTFHLALDGTVTLDTPVDTSIQTRIQTVTSPLDNSIQASTTVTFSGTYYIASSTIATTSNTFFYIYVQNMSNDTATSSLNDYTILNFPVTSLNTILNFSTTTVLLNDSRFSWNGSVRRGDVNYGPVPFSNGESFYQFTTGSFDPTFGRNFDLSSCNPFSGVFSVSTCLYNLIVPNNVAYPLAFNEAKEELGRRVPWGYVTRIIEILTSSTTASSMPSINYSFASSSPMSSVGEIHFEPFTLIAQSGTLINEMKSDRTDSKSVWEIFGPFINIFIYVVLIFMIIHDLTGVHSSKVDNEKE